MIVELDARKLAAFEIAARLDALIAEPHVSPKRHADLVRRLCADQIAATIEAFPETRAELVASYPQYNPVTVRIQTNELQAKREDAFKVGALVLALVARTAVGRAARLPEQCRSVSLDQMIPVLWPRDERVDEEMYLMQVHDIERLKVRPRYPVAHLAAAMQWVARERTDNGETLTWDYQDLAFLRDLVARAQTMAMLIRATPGLENMANRLIELHWINDDLAIPA